MKKVGALIMCMRGCGAALFAQTEAGFDTEMDGYGVGITEYKGRIPATRHTTGYQ